MREKSLQTKLAVFFLAGAFLVTGVLAPAPRPAHAQEAVVVVGSLLEPITQGILKMATQSASGVEALVIKEYTLDSLAWVIAKLVIQQMTQSIVDWINGGFDGNPVFVSDLNGYLADIADQIAGAFIEGSELGFLCDPFRRPIQRALELQHITPFEQQISCRLTDVVDNIEDFTAGDFRSGGWDGWFELTVRDNPYKRYLEASNELNQRISAKQAEEIKLLEFGRGFLSWRDCSGFTGGDAVGAVGALPSVENCPVVTPGAVIEGQLQQTLSLGLDQLNMADELDEIVAALIAGLVQETFTSSSGLFGLSQSNYGEPSYTAQLGSDTTLTDNTLETTGNPAVDSVIRLIEDERAYKSVKESSLGAVLSAEPLNEELRVCNASRASSFDAVITSRKNQLLADIAAVDKNLDDLEAARVSMETATTPEEVTDATLFVTSLQASGRLHDFADLLVAQDENGVVTKEMSNLRSDISKAIGECDEEASGGRAVGESIR